MQKSSIGAVASSWQRLAARSLAAIGGVWVAVAQAIVPTPTVTGPIASDAPGSPDHNYTFFATDIVLKNYGYTEEEFFYSGTANVYDAAAPTGGVGNSPKSSPTANIIRSGVPFKSKLVVRRPTDPSKFNGTVIVEWSNVTNNYDTEVWWLKGTKDFLMREGYAYVEVSAQNAGLNGTPNGIRFWSPLRYGSLNIIGTINSDGSPNGATALTGDALGWDVYSQAAAAIRNVPIVLGGLPISRVIGVGESQSAGRLGVYMNAVHVRDPIYDGFVISEGGEIIRSDLTVPVIKFTSETEFAGQTNEIGELQPDTSKFRLWPLAGASHSEETSLQTRAAVLMRDLGQDAIDTCATPSRSRVQTKNLYSSSVDAMNKWLMLGTPPAIADRFILTNAPAVGVARDAYGNALGAIRTAELDVPVAKEGGDTCALGGTHIPFTTDVLKSLYSSHDDYVNKVTTAALSSVAKGFVLAADAQEQIAKAKASIWGMGLECGPLCADVKQFPTNPSAILLRNQTHVLQILGADGALVPVLDSTVLAVAKGYTAGIGTAAANADFKQAIAYLNTYIVLMNQTLARGNTRPETASLMVNQANTLKAALAALIGP